MTVRFERFAHSLSFRITREGKNDSPPVSAAGSRHGQVGHPPGIAAGPTTMSTPITALQRRQAVRTLALTALKTSTFPDSISISSTDSPSSLCPMKHPDTPPREQLCNRYCSNKHTPTCMYTEVKWGTHTLTHADRQCYRQTHTHTARTCLAYVPSHSLASPQRTLPAHEARLTHEFQLPDPGHLPPAEGG